MFFFLRLFRRSAPRYAHGNDQRDSQAPNLGIEFDCEYSILFGGYGKSLCFSLLQTLQCQEKNGVYWCSVGICMTAIISTLRSGQSGWLGGRPAATQSDGRCISYAPLEIVNRLKVYLRRASQHSETNREKG
jgi:hypothetical protein